MVVPSPLLMGNQLSLADCGFAPSFAILRCLQTLLSFDFVLPERLRTYETALVAHPSVCNEYDDYVATLEKWAAAKCSET